MTATWKCDGSFGDIDEDQEKQELSIIGKYFNNNWDTRDRRGIAPT